MFRFFIFALSIWLTAGIAHALQSLPLDTGRTEISLVSDHNIAAPGQSFTVALRMEFEGNWYTYWRNAGDSGEPVQIIWDLPEGVTAGPIQWPAPKVKTVGPIVSYAMGGEVWLPVTITVDEAVNPNQPITLRAHAYYLVCDDVCVPEDGALSLPIGLGSAAITSDHMAKVQKAKDKIPQVGDANGSAHLENGRLVFNVTDLPTGFNDAQLFPNENPIIVHSDAVDFAQAVQGLQFQTTPGYGWEDATPSGFKATLVAKDGQSIVVPIATDSIVEIGALNTRKAPISFTNLLGAAFGAFLGGLILNLMPCVFPIISLKALSISKTAHGERETIRRSAWAYTGGVLVSFLIFAGLLIAFKAAGSSVGWGFQLQSPWLVALLSLLLFAIGLNLLGVFDIGGRLQNIGAGHMKNDGRFSSFLTGILAVIVATPCTAPFMAGAVGLALTGSAVVTLIIFIALGLGFALPFLIIAYVPGLLSKLPKPGAWMETFKQFLAFPMFGAAIFFTWVLAQQSGASGTWRILSAALALSFAIWVFRKTGGLAKIFGGIALAVALILSIMIKPLDGAATAESSAWSAEAVAAAQAEGRPVFVDFTAAWCITCKANELAVLNRKKTATLFESTDTEFLIADWTNKDDVIAAELKRHGRAGVPLYLVYRPGETEAKILPQVLTYDILKEALE